MSCHHPRSPLLTALLILGFAGVSFQVAADPTPDKKSPMAQHEHGDMQASDSEKMGDISQMDHAGHMDHDMGSMDHAGHMDHDMGSMNHMDHAAHMAMMHNAGKYRKQTVSYNLPDLELIDMMGKHQKVSAIFGTDKPVLLNFIFTTCTTICPIMTATFSQAQDMLMNELDGMRMISISIDPEQDTPDALLKYAAKYKANPNWDFYTGKINDVVTLLKAFDAYHGDKMNHQPLTMIRAGKSSPWLRIDGLTSAKDLVAEYHAVVEGKTYSQK